MLRKQIKTIDELNECFLSAKNGEPVIIKNKRNNVVMLSLKDYKVLEKAKRNLDYVNKLDEGFEQIRLGVPGIKKSLEELKAMAK